MTPADEKPNAKRLKADKIYLIALIRMYFRPANTMNSPYMYLSGCAQWHACDGIEKKSFYHAN